MGRPSNRRCPSSTCSKRGADSFQVAALVKPNLPLRRRVPRTFMAVILFFAMWAAIMGLVIVSPGAIGTLFFLTQQISGWIFLIAVAIVGAIFIGMFISHRLLTHGGFTPFEEEMLRMRRDVEESREHLKKVREEVGVMRVEVARMRRASRGGHSENEGAEEGRAAPGLSAELSGGRSEGRDDGEKV